MNSISDGSLAPASIAAGDIFVVMMSDDMTDFRWLGGVITQSHFDNAQNVGNTLPEIGFGEYNARFQERAGTLTMEVQRAGNWSGTSTVHYEIFDRDGVANIQFVPVSGSIAFGPGETTKTIQIPLLDDNAYAGAVNNFVVELTDPAGATLDPIRRFGSIFIREDDPVPHFIIPPVIAKEGDGTTNVPFEVTIDGALAKPFDLRWECFGCYNGNIVIQPGDTHRSATLTFLGNTDVDGDRTYSFDFSSPLNELFHLASSTVTIHDDDAALTSITIDDVTVIEGTGAATMRVRVSPATIADFDLRLRTHAITADPGADFDALDAHVTVASGASEVEIAIPIADDDVIEEDETLAVALSEPSVLNVVFADAEASLRILDNDAQRLAATSRDVTVVEGHNATRNATFEVQLTHAASFPVLVHYQTTDVTARAGSDYTAASGTLTFAPGETLKQVDVAIHGDTTIEDHETFELQLGVDGTSMPSVRGTIRNDDTTPTPRKRAARH